MRIVCVCGSNGGMWREWRMVYLSLSLRLLSRSPSLKTPTHPQTQSAGFPLGSINMAALLLTVHSLCVVLG